MMGKFGLGVGSLKFLNLAGCRRKSSIAASKIQFNEYGDPAKVLSLVDFELPQSVSGSQVLLKMLAAPVHPADFNTVQGVYGIRPELPAVPGLEGVGEVLQVGPEVRHLAPGDRVIPIQRNFGTWKTHHVCNEDHLDKVPKSVPLISAAMILVNPVTAYRMIHDFVVLHPGDTIIQNSANSAVGQMVIQIARHLGFNTVNVIRQRPDLDKMVKKLKDLGANVVLTEEDLRSPATKEVFKDIPLARVAFNGTGGPAATDMLRWVSNGSKLVTYGAMSRKPVAASATALIFRDISFHGFWCNHFTTDPSKAADLRLTLDALYNLASHGQLQPPAHFRVPLRQYRDALDRAVAPFVGEKQMLIMDAEAK